MSFNSIADPENIEAIDLQRKLEMLNNIMDQEARAEQARRQMQYFGCELILYLVELYFINTKYHHKQVNTIPLQNNILNC